MKSLKLYQLLFVRLLLLIIAVGVGVYAFSQKLPYTAFLCLLIFVFLLIELFAFIRNIFLFYDKTINAILNDDFSSDFSRHSTHNNYKSLFKLYDTLKNRRHEQVSKDMVYSAILNNIETGVVILQKDDADWNVFLMNDYFSSHFDVPKVSKWKYLRNQLPALCTIIEDRNFDDIRTSVQIKLGIEESQTFMLQTSKTKTYGHDYYIILLDSIQKVIAKKEKDAWINLMKVISHELMNSITPIRSLTQNLNELIQQESLSKDDMEDIKQSVTTMIHRSDHLQSFIESYRKLAMLPSPQKEKIELTALINNVLNIMGPLFKNKDIRVNNAITFNRWLMADVLQIEHALINLLTNSIFALDNNDIKNIEIAAEVKSNRIFIIITDNGRGIEKEIEDKIFLPFFTTRNDGAGIGLTLSKNIIEAHGGYLSYNNLDGKTQFIICLIEQ
ncbi:histidine kinase [Flavobacterium rivuli WB 3.3-2 = DSM 21788]|uniref:histidine kinase n=1 Tax=Flavobacterium rivuli WB 3.3-2 = DSM 21788 TaxID=1121895 RepID=A0A0A2LYF9_9FLAO|nr:ATP-binding protein [Flavobacterium rivuli]KGO85049.1 histidine kinase [Flavobacterium rivuli WB 3.3-2 = DSM 21788]